MKNYLIVAKLNKQEATKHDTYPLLHQLGIDEESTQEFTFRDSDRHIIVSDILISDEGENKTATMMLLDSIIDIVAEDRDFESAEVQSLVNVCDALGIETVKYFLHKEYIEFYEGVKIPEDEYVEFYNLTKEIEE